MSALLVVLLLGAARQLPERHNRHTRLPERRTMPPNFDPWAPDAGEAPLKKGKGVVTELALAALDQVCWHLTCCDFIFDVVEEESDVLFHQLAADIEQARFRAEGVYEAASQLKRITSDPTNWQSFLPAVSEAPNPPTTSSSSPTHDSGISSAGKFLGHFESAFDGGDSPLLYFTDEWPTCQDIRGKNGMRRCEQPVLYLGEGQWSANCRRHARRADRERHEHWDAAREAEIMRDGRLRAERRREVGRAVIGWWRRNEGPMGAIRKVLN